MSELRRRRNEMEPHHQQMLKTQLDVIEQIHQSMGIYSQKIEQLNFVSSQSREQLMQWIEQSQLIGSQMYQQFRQLMAQLDLNTTAKIERTEQFFELDFAVLTYWAISQEREQVVQFSERMNLARRRMIEQSMQLMLNHCQKLNQLFGLMETLLADTENAQPSNIVPANLDIDHAGKTPR